MWDTAPKLVLGYPGLLPCWKAPNALMKHNRKDSAIGDTARKCEAGQKKFGWPLSPHLHHYPVLPYCDILAPYCRSVVCIDESIYADVWSMVSCLVDLFSIIPHCRRLAPFGLS